MKTLKQCIINEQSDVKGHSDVKGDLVKANELKFIRNIDDVLAIIGSVLDAVKFNEVVCMAIDKKIFGWKEFFTDEFKEDVWNCLVSDIHRCGEEMGCKWAQSKK